MDPLPIVNALTQRRHLYLFASICFVLVARCGCCFARSDPDEENFSGGWFVQRVHSARLKLRASCGTLSFLMAGPQDYVLGALARVWKVVRAGGRAGPVLCPLVLRCDAGVQNGSIAGTEGITFHSGDGAHDTDGALHLTCTFFVDASMPFRKSGASPSEFIACKKTPAIVPTGMCFISTFACPCNFRVFFFRRARLRGKLSPDCCQGHGCDFHAEKP